jgi:hypothetical protein
MADNLIDNAIQAPNTPADGPPVDATETRRQEISREPDFWKDGPNTKALRAEMQRLTTAPDVLAKREQAETEAAEALSPEEQRIEAANANPALWDKNHKDHDAARRELRLALAANQTDDERQAWASTPLREKREVFNLPAPQLPAEWLENYMESYGAHEGDFIGLARAEGLTGQQVRGLRDEAIQLGQLVAESGKPASDEDLKRLLDKYSVPAASREGLIRLWRSVEGEPA